MRARAGRPGVGVHPRYTGVCAGMEETPGAARAQAQPTWWLARDAWRGAGRGGSPGPVCRGEQAGGGAGDRGPPGHTHSGPQIK